MNDILIKNPQAVMTGLRGERARAGSLDIRIRGGRIAEMAKDLQPGAGERVIDARHCLVYPGWINTHHHLAQNLLKAVPAGLNQDLQGWLASVPYPRLARFTTELVQIAARLGMAELLLSGVTTCADHHYLYHANGGTESGDALFDIAEEFGMRFVLCRGGALESANAHPGFSKTALQPESLEQMLGDIERLKGRYHQDTPDALRRVVVAPTTPTFSLPPTLLRELAQSARHMGLRLHTHLSETQNYVNFCREKYNCLPVEFVAEHEWLGPDVWFAHMVHAQPSEICLLAQTGSGISHCPVSNARLGSGIAPVPQMAAAGVPISLGVDGVASNESGSMVGEANTAWLIHRANQGASATLAEDVIHWGTAGGATVLGLGAVGTLEVGQAADLVLYGLDHPRFFGFHDPALAPVLAGEPMAVRYSLVGGRLVVDDGVIPGLDLERLRREALDGVQQLLQGD
ncbi:amidohydrolase family protein [Pseudomonas tohonis]|uniref:amidohydrolase family protein n=1 Tax=Pseudomonas tohonis TaxID=2725477 RepID=UPI0021D86E0A|nr:amidohydrolase family protein [Pseudomonas tohonis]UXY53856.1 amidohydrolase family protein [Pseudomonas tohonis]